MPAEALRLPDPYLWVEAYTLDALCSVAVEHWLAAAPAWIDKLALVAGRAGMREFAVRANVYRARLSDASALTAPGLLTAEVENPALASMVAETATPRRRP